MIEQALYDHLIASPVLAPLLTTYNGVPAVFNQEAPADSDPLWADGTQYGRVVFAVDIQNDPERTVSGTLAVDIQCRENEMFPEVVEPVVRDLIHGWFFSANRYTAEAQWKSTQYFTEPTDKVLGCTIVFDLLAFPLMSTGSPDVIERLNEWTSEIEGLFVLNFDSLPTAAWRPDGNASAIYWRLVEDKPASWIPDTFQTIWRTASVRGHIFSANQEIAGATGRAILTRMYAEKRLLKDGESPIMVNIANTITPGADPLKTGQIGVDATYAIIVHIEPDPNLVNINIRGEEESAWRRVPNDRT